MLQGSHSACYSAHMKDLLPVIEKRVQEVDALEAEVLIIMSRAKEETEETRARIRALRRTIRQLQELAGVTVTGKQTRTRPAAGAPSTAHRILGLWEADTDAERPLKDVYAGLPDLKQGTVNAALGRLVKAGELVRLRLGVYALPLEESTAA